ncbi:DUF6602 domain-containing protein [Methylobacterium sp. CM6244]
MSKYSETLGKLSKTLVAQSDTIFEHNGNRGDSRESAVIAYLYQVFPTAYGFAKGEIFDADGTNSGEVDVIIYDTVHSPVFRDTSNKLLCPNESSYGAIEVKSNLTKLELNNCQEKIARYRKLQRPQAPPNTRFITPYTPFSAGGALRIQSSDNSPIYGVFAYTNSIALDTILAELQENENIAFIVVPNEFIFIGIPWVFEGEIRRNFIIRTPKSVAIWVLLLQACLTNTHLIGADVTQLLAAAVDEAVRGYP